MDLAPLTTAQRTARTAASKDTHELAARQYSAAAQGIHDTEALRILALLESHHQQLAHIINSPTVSKTPVNSSNPAAQSEPSVHPPAVTETAGNGLENSVGPASRPVTSTSLQRRITKEISSTIASDLATARGIPAHQQRRSSYASPNSVSGGVDATREGRGDRSSARRVESGKSRVQSTTLDPAATIPSANSSSSVTQGHERTFQPKNKLEIGEKADGFNRFYSRFEGLLSKLSAPLAFAGLPLTPEDRLSETSKTRNQTARAMRTTQVAAADSPDVTGLFSKAALRAVKDDNPGFGSLQDSYMVVPTSGGTMSYAGVLSRHEGGSPEGQSAPAVDEREQGADAFVDATEVSPRLQPKEGQELGKKSAEELESENKSLKQMIDNLSRRLYMWEKSAQTQSMALQQSFKTLQVPSTSVATEASTSAEDMDARVKELEQQLALARKETQRYERENEKLKNVVMRYRERWEKLKEGARVRREGAGTGAGREGDKGTGDAVD